MKFNFFLLSFLYGLVTAADENTDDTDTSNVLLDGQLLKDYLPLSEYRKLRLVNKHHRGLNKLRMFSGDRTPIAEIDNIQPEEMNKWNEIKTICTSIEHRKIIDNRILPVNGKLDECTEKLLDFQGGIYPMKTLVEGETFQRNPLFHFVGVEVGGFMDDYEEGNCITIFERLKNRSKIKKVTFYGELVDECVEWVKGNLLDLEELQISSESDENIPILMNYLFPSYQSLKKLSFSLREEREAVVEALDANKDNLGNLEYLSMDSRFDDLQMAQLSNLFYKLGKMKVLILNWNILGNDHNLALAFKSMNNLERLEAVSTKIGQNFLSKLDNFPKLKYLDISHNEISVADAKVLAEQLKSLKSLEVLKINGKLHGSAVESLSVALKSLSNLKKLEMNSVQMGNAGFNALISNIRDNKQLVVLELNNIGVTDEVTPVLITFIESRQRLSMGFGENGISREKQDEIKRFFKREKRVRFYRQ